MQVCVSGWSLPHAGRPSAEQRLKAEARWVERQAPDLVLALLRSNWAACREGHGPTP